jgi:hypothetical protein
MKNLVDSILQDLRERRLWPVALLLVIALIAIPLVMIKPAKEPDAATASGAAPGKVKTLTSLSEVAVSGEGSSLDVFDETDPFLPPSAVIAASKEAGTTAGPSTSTTEGGALGAGTGDSGGSGSSTGGGSTTTGGTGGGTTGGGDTGGGGGGTTTTKYTYVVDVTFTRNDRTRSVNGLERLEMLPSESDPLLIFLGASASGDEAVFLVDSTLRASGEGNCEPSNDNCGTLSIGAGSVEEFTDGDGNSYKLRIDEIRRVKLSAASAKSSRRKGKRARASSAASRRFVPPMLADLVTVATTADEASSSDKDSR